jgi:cytochrome c-type biogenesis protein CcmH
MLSLSLGRPKAGPEGIVPLPRNAGEEPAVRRDVLHIIAWFAFVLVALALSVGPALAVQPDEKLVDPALEARARGISAELRCLVCQNQSIDDSDAPLARDLRILVRERLTAGDSDTEVQDYLVARYGDFILLKPRFAGYTLILWLTPLAVLAVGAFVALRRFRKPPDGAAKLSGEEEETLARILRK